MSQTTEMWLVDQLRRMAKTQPERFEGFVRSLKQALPAEFEELALMALDDGGLDATCCAAVLMVESDELDVRLEGYRNNTGDLTDGLVEHDGHGVARIVDTHVAVWEVVRVFRRVGSVAELKQAYNSLSERELRAALAYAGNNPDEIATCIEQYEAVVNRTREAYPFAAITD
ncbi:MAG: DUF433 domain-containing protein [Fimbriimonadaceae bacterium]|nr:DUF433 domain-containing protein [Fimbriimonadaceae bacterium]